MADDLELLPVRRHRQLAARWVIVSGVLLAVQIAVGLAFGSAALPLIQGVWLVAAGTAHGHYGEARGYRKGYNDHG